MWSWANFAQSHRADQVSLGLPMRALLSLLPLVPAWWVVRAGLAIERHCEDLRAIQFGVMGVLLLMLAPRYLRDLWRPNTDCLRERRATRLAENRLELELRRQLEVREEWPPPPPRRW